MESINKPTIAFCDLVKDKNNLSNEMITKDLLDEQSSVIVPLQKTADEILQELVKGVAKIDFESLAFNEIYADKIEVLNQLQKSEVVSFNEGENNAQNSQQKKISNFVLSKNHYIIISIEELIKIANLNKWGLCIRNGSIYLYNGSYWSEIDKERFQFFLGEIALKMGVEKFKGKIHTFKTDLFKQFMADAFLSTPKRKNGEVLINLQNGTFEIKPTRRGLKAFDQKDFLTHQLPFKYDLIATAPLFQKYLDEVLPDQDKQKVLAEYCAYIFIKPNILKLEKVLMLFGTGANGKSVFFEIINALLGNENVSNYSLQSLTNDNGYYRAKLGSKLLNYASEISGKLEADIFKQMASGEPIEARLPYGEPFILTDYAKLMFNCNELPNEVEHTVAFFRRFLIINFDVTIPESKQDKELSKKIIESELSGVFNWILEGLDRLLLQKNFSKCTAIDNARSEYEKQSDSVQLFINENGFKTSSTEYVLISDLHKLYKAFCDDDGLKPLGKSKFIKRLDYLKLFVTRVNKGNVVHLTKDMLKT